MLLKCLSHRSAAFSSPTRRSSYLPLHGGLWKSYADHRMATAGAIIGLRVEGVEVDDIETTAKTLPGFAQMRSEEHTSELQSRGQLVCIFLLDINNKHLYYHTHLS